jgi:glycosyltransferase involved in cell wall biosynthesis
VAKKIYFEGLGLVEGHFSGVGQYTLGIMRGIDAILEREKIAGNKTPDVEVIIPYNTIDRFNSFGFKHLRAKRFPLNFRVMSGLWHRGKMPPIDLYCGQGYYVFTRFVGMPLAFSKSAVVIYDISFELYKQYSDEGNARFLSNGIKRTLKKTRTVFTISQNAKQEIVDFYGVAPENVLIATPAADQRYLYRRSSEEIERVKTRYGVNKDYILALSNLEPRKNLDTLVDAYCALPESYRDNTSLLLVGVSGWKTDKLFKKIVAKVEEGYDIIRPSHYVSDEDKPAIISGAKMLVYPSHYEGFGMPPVEALACGVPVIAANNSSLPEAVGDAGTLVTCTDTVEITKQIAHHLDNLGEITEKVRSTGPAQAEKFSWERSAQIYWDYIWEQMK